MQKKGAGRRWRNPQPTISQNPGGGGGWGVSHTRTGPGRPPLGCNIYNACSCHQRHSMLQQWGCKSVMQWLPTCVHHGRCTISTTTLHVPPSSPTGRRRVRGEFHPVHLQNTKSSRNHTECCSDKEFFSQGGRVSEIIETHALGPWGLRCGRGPFERRKTTIFTSS